MTSGAWLLFTVLQISMYFTSGRLWVIVKVKSPSQMGISTAPQDQTAGSPPEGRDRGPAGQRGRQSSAELSSQVHLTLQHPLVSMLTWWDYKTEGLRDQGSAKVECVKYEQRSQWNHRQGTQEENSFGV